MSERSNGFDPVVDGSLEVATDAEVQVLAQLARGLHEYVQLAAKPSRHQFVPVGTKCRRFRFRETVVTGLIYNPEKTYPDVRICTEWPIGEPLSNGNQLIQSTECFFRNRSLFRTTSKYVAEISPATVKLETATGLQAIGIASKAPKWDRSVHLTAKEKESLKEMTAIENGGQLRHGFAVELQYLLQAAATAQAVESPDRQDG